MKVEPLMARKKQQKRIPKTTRIVSPPPHFDSRAAKELFTRLRAAPLDELHKWSESGALKEFSRLHLCEGALLSTLLFQKLERWGDVCRTGESFLKAIDDVQTQTKSASQRARCRVNAALVLDLMGQSYVRLEEYQRAALCFETAIELNPLIQDAYIHWAELARHLGMSSLSSRIVSAGLKMVPGSPEMRMFQQGVTDCPTVSVCMIVKNEEEFLEDCLMSVRDIANEIILVDTGSDDRTIEIAESFGCKVFHQEWEGDFSKHRNYSIEQATSDWIFIIDADERLIEQDIPKLKECLSKTEFDLLSLTVYNVSERSGKSATFLPSVRIFRRDLGLRYEGIVHNRLNYKSDMKELRCPVGLLHHGYDLSPEKMKQKHERSLALLEKQLAEDPKHAFAHFNLAQLIRARGNLESRSDCQKVIEHAAQVIELTEPNSPEFGSIHLMAHHQLATAYYSLGDYQRAEEACLSALRIDETYLDCVIMLAHVYRLQERYDEAVSYYHKYLELQEAYSEHQQTNTLIIVHLNSRANANYNLGLIAEKATNYQEALERYRRALREEGVYLDANTRAGWMCYRLSQRETAQEYFRKDIEAYPQRDSAYLGLAETYVYSGEYDAAEATLRNGLLANAESDAILSRYCDLLVDLSRAQEALQLLRDHDRVDSEEALVCGVRGRIELSLGQVEQARDSFMKAAAVAAPDSRTLAGLADANLMLENSAEACEWYVKALSRDPHSAHLMRNYAIALARNGLHAEAVERLLEYVPVAPDDRESRLILGALLLRLNRGGEALAVYEQMLRESPADEEALLALSDCYLSLGGDEAAKVGYGRLLAANPNHRIAKERLKSLESHEQRRDKTVA